MTSSKPTIYVHDETSIYYPTGPGEAHAITFEALADADGSDEHYAKVTTTVDLLALPGRLPVREGETPHPWHDMGMLADDFSDTLGMWADYCERVTGQQDGELVAA